MTVAESTAAPPDVNPLLVDWPNTYECPTHNRQLTVVGAGGGHSTWWFECPDCGSGEVLERALWGAKYGTVVEDLAEHGERLDAFLDDDSPDFDWVVEGLLERRDRVILTGPEKAGKSTLLRQVAVRLAAGWHPFEESRLDGGRVVLFVDTENNRTDLRRKFRQLQGLADELGSDDTGRVHLVSKPEGLDLRRPDALEWLHQVVQIHGRPDVLVIGPAYKLGSGDPSSEEVARQVTGALDEFRTRHNCAVLLEHHVPHAGPNGRRPHRPIGSSLWGRWCEVALHLSTLGVLSRWQPMRDERAWPERLRRGDTWPWVAETNPAELEWGRVVGFIEERGCLSQNQLAAELNIPRSSLQRLVKAHRDELNELCPEVAA